MTANVIEAGTADADVDPAEDGSLLDDGAMGHAGIYGFVVGTVVMTALCFLFGLIAGIDADVAIAIAPVPGVVAGLFFGMTGFIGANIARHGH